MMSLKNRALAVKSAIGAAILVPAVALAQTSPDFSGMTDQIKWDTAVTAILVIAGGLAGVYVVVKGARMIISMLRGG